MSSMFTVAKFLNLWNRKKGLIIGEEEDDHSDGEGSQQRKTNLKTLFKSTSKGGKQVSGVNDNAALQKSKSVASAPKQTQAKPDGIPSSKTTSLSSFRHYFEEQKSSTELLTTEEKGMRVGNDQESIPGMELEGSKVELHSRKHSEAENSGSSVTSRLPIKHSQFGEAFHGDEGSLLTSQNLKSEGGVQKPDKVGVLKDLTELVIDDYKPEKQPSERQKQAPSDHLVIDDFQPIRRPSERRNKKSSNADLGVDFKWDSDVLKKFQADSDKLPRNATELETVEWSEDEEEEEEYEEDEEYSEGEGDEDGQWESGAEEEEGGEFLVTPEMRKRRLKKFPIHCPPGGEEDVVLYVTSFSGIRKTFAECNKIRMILQGLSLEFDERDVSVDAGYRSELTSILGYPAVVPQLFVRGHHIGGSEVVVPLNDDQILVEMVEGIPRVQQPGKQCEACGDRKFVMCVECSGKGKIWYDDGTLEDCFGCNENGLTRCPMC